MNEALNALKVLKELQYRFYYSKNGIDISTFIQMRLDIIETALKNYAEGLENSKTYVKHTSSQALYDLLGLAIKNVHKSFWKLPEQLYDDASKSIKALDIIKVKNVNAGNFIYWLKRKPRTYDDYLNDFYQEQWYLHYKDNNDNNCKFYKLTKDEFEIMKEELL